jgi:hypothetical protein
MKPLLTITAVVETLTGIGLAASPRSVVLALLGSPLDSPAGVIIARVLGAALFALGAACWLARDDPGSRAAAGLIAAMLLYNIAAVSLLGYARIGLGMSGAGLLPAAMAHSALLVWCLACLVIGRREVSIRTDSREAVTDRNVTEEGTDKAI